MITEMRVAVIARAAKTKVGNVLTKMQNKKVFFPVAGCLLIAILAGLAVIGAHAKKAPVHGAHHVAAVAPARHHHHHKTTTSPPKQHKPKPAVAKPPAAAKTYTVKSGDTLWTIAMHKLGSGLKWVQIWHLNKGQVPNPNLIYAGMVLQL